MDEAVQESTTEKVREKFISVVEPIVLSGDANNISSLLSSLTNICKAEPDLLVIPSQENAHDQKSIEFSCWLISQLLLIDNTEAVEDSVTDLLSNILFIISTKNVELYAEYLKNLLLLSKEATSLLYKGESLNHQCFSSLVDVSVAALKPKQLPLKTDSSLDKLLIKLIKVFGETVHQTLLFAPSQLNEVWMIIGQSLENGCLSLKIAALNIISCMMTSCYLPNKLETQYFIIQLITGCSICAVKGEFSNDASSPSDNELVQLFETALCRVFDLLATKISSIDLCLFPDIVSSIEQFLSFKNRFSIISSDLLRRFLQFTCKLLDHYQPSANYLKRILDEAVENNIILPEVISICLKKFLVNEFSNAIPSQSSGIKTKKRTAQQSSVETVLVLASSVGSWWGKVETEIRSSLATLGLELNFEDFETQCDLIINYANLASEVLASFSQENSISVQFFPDDILESVTEIVYAKVSNTENVQQVSKALLLLHHIVYVNNASNVESKTVRRLEPSWVALASLPWLPAEIHFLDLKAPDLKSMASFASKAQWANDISVKLNCIPLLSISLPNASPQWRCHLVKRMLSEGNSSILQCLSSWLPMILNHLPKASSQMVLGEAIGKLLESRDEQILESLSKSLPDLFCVIINAAFFMPRQDSLCTSKSLKCSVNHDMPNNGSVKVDQALSLQLMSLINCTQTSVLLNVIEAIPSIVTHCIVSKRILDSLLKLLESEDYEVIGAFCNKIHLLLPAKKGLEDDDSVEDQMEKHILGLLKKLLENSNDNSRIHYATIKALHQLTTHKRVSFDGFCFFILLKCLMSSDNEVSSLTHLLVLHWTQKLDISPKELYLTNRKVVAQVLVNFLEVGKVHNIVSKVAELFHWSASNGDRKRQNHSTRLGWFVNSQTCHILPPLVVVSSDTNQPSLLIEYSKCCGSRLRDLLIDHFQHILAYLVCHSDVDEKEKVLRFISTTTDIPICQIKKCSLQNQVNELIMGLHSHREAVLREFLAIEALERDQEPRTDFSLDKIKTTVAKFLAPRLLGILGFLDGKLVSSSTMYKDKQGALLSLKDLLLILGKEHVSPVARKILASLKMAMKIKSPHFVSITCQAWISYLQSLDESTLEGVIEEVLIITMPIIRLHPDQMAPILKTIIIHSKCLQPLWKNLPMLPEDPHLTPINKVLTKAQKCLQGNTADHLVENLNILHRGLLHESVDVRRFYLVKLRSVLSTNQKNVHHLILESHRAHLSISNIYKGLFDLCREKEELLLLVAECMGLLGAIDPARLQVPKNSGGESNNFSTIETKEFVLFLVQEIARSVLSATDTMTQTCALYAMQEIIKIYKIGAPIIDIRDETSLGNVVYKELPSNIQELLHPLQSSKYTVQNAKSSTIPSPVYGTKYAHNFNQWITNWVCSLVDLLVKDISKQVFNPCKPIMRRDKVTALEFLPPLLICVLTESSMNQTPVVTEILAVLQHEKSSESTDEMQLSSSNAKNKLQNSKKLQHMAVQTIFTCLDYANRWAHNRKQKHFMYSKSNANCRNPIELTNIQEFLDQIPAISLAKTSFHFQAYSRALRSLELHLKEYPQEVKSNLRFLQSIYTALDDPDGVAGVAAIRQDNPSLDEQVIEYEATGRIHDALGCYERICSEGGSSEAHRGMLKCYLKLDQPQSVLNITQGLISQKPQLSSELNEFRVEAAWRLGQWDRLEEFLKTETAPSWGIGVGKLFLAARERDSRSYEDALKDLRIQCITPVTAASMELGAIQRASPHIVRLQTLTEVEELLIGILQIPLKLSKVSDERPPTLSLEDLNARWDNRLSLVQTSHRYLEPILSFRRTLLQIGRDWLKDTDPQLSLTLTAKLESTWLQSAKVARKSGLCEQGEWAFFGTGHGRDVFMEKAKWYWIKGDQPKAVSTLKRGLEKFFPSTDFLKKDFNESTADRRDYAKAKLLLAHYTEESAIMEVQAIKSLYRNVCESYKEWEDGHFNLSMYYERIIASFGNQKPADWLIHIVQSFAKSLTYGCKHLYQSMPRLLSIWLDFGAQTTEMTSKGREILKSLNKYLEQLLDKLPLYMFFVALPQLISRICHSRDDVFIVLKKILATVLCKYPQQSMWHMIQVSKSSYSMRRERCINVFEAAKQQTPSLERFIHDATRLADLFIELANKPVDKGVLQVNLKLSRTLSSVISNPRFSQIILPLQNQMNVILPSIHTTHDIVSLHNHNPFPTTEIFLTGIEDNVEIMQSLVQPKKITLNGSDGKKYFMMCKPKDDLRKDCRLMEFNAFVNRLLMRNPESRKRDLKIRTYTVVPLNEECGLIEWVPNLMGLRPILVKLYREMGRYTSGGELKRCMCKTSDSLEVKRNVFVTKLLPKHPSVMSKWLLNNFFDPQSWLRARVSYCRTTAVMSMVGYILGLGDRHGENILFDSTSGEAVHVDLNCLFNKGETFDWPERVPFRLTHNLVDAMGPTGYEGVFRKTSEVTMRVMRMEKEELMSILKPFIHDPLVEWQKASRKSTGEIYNLLAQNHVKDIENRLSGQIKTRDRGFQLPLSVEGQVNFLLEEATNIDNLCQMYIGWAAFM